MNIYIPQHLREIKIIDNLCRMIEGYADKFDPGRTSFDDYREYLKSDPVKNFISLCIKDPVQRENETPAELLERYRDYINYISKCFYSVKGTQVVFEYMRRYLDKLEVGEEVIYNGETLSISLKNVELSDEFIFQDALRKFLNALLYFKDFSINNNHVTLNIRSDIKNYIATGLVQYKEFLLEEVML